jgi:hypothetical protein
MNVRQLLAVATAATLLLPGTALAGKGNGKPHGKPEGVPAAPHSAAGQRAADTQTLKIRTLEGPEGSTENVETPTTEAPEGGEVVTKPSKKAQAKSRKAAKRACKGLSKKRVKGKKGTPYSRCIVAAAQRHKQPVVEPLPVETAEPAPVQEPAPAEPTEPVQPTGPVEAPAV